MKFRNILSSNLLLVVCIFVCLLGAATACGRDAYRRQARPLKPPGETPPPPAEKPPPPAEKPPPPAEKLPPPDDPPAPSESRPALPPGAKVPGDQEPPSPPPGCFWKWTIGNIFKGESLFEWVLSCNLRRQQLVKMCPKDTITSELLDHLTANMPVGSCHPSQECPAFNHFCKTRDMNGVERILVYPRDYWPEMPRPDPEPQPDPMPQQPPQPMPQSYTDMYDY